MKSKILTLTLLTVIAGTASAGSRWDFGYSGGNYNSTSGYHASKAYDNYDGSNQFKSTNSSNVTTYAKTPAKIKNGYVSGQYTKYE